MTETLRDYLNRNGGRSTGTPSRLPSLSALARTRSRGRPGVVGPLRAGPALFDDDDDNTLPPLVPGLLREGANSGPSGWGRFNPVREVTNALTDTARGLFELGKVAVSIPVGSIEATYDGVTSAAERATGWDLPGGWDESPSSYYGPATQFVKGLPQMARNVHDVSLTIPTPLNVASQFGEYVSKIPGVPSPIRTAAGAWDSYVDGARNRTIERYRQSSHDNRLLSEFVGDAGTVAMGAGAGASLIRAGAKTARVTRLQRLAQSRPVSAITAGRSRNIGVTRYDNAGRVLPTRAQAIANSLDRMSYRADWSDPAIAAGRAVRAGLSKFVPNPSSRLRSNFHATDTETHRRGRIAESRQAVEILDSRTQQAMWEAFEPSRDFSMFAEVAGVDPRYSRIITMLVSGAYENIVREVSRSLNAGMVDLAHEQLARWNSHPRFQAQGESMHLSMDDIEMVMEYATGDLQVSNPKAYEAIQTAATRLMEHNENQAVILRESGRVENMDELTQQPTLRYKTELDDMGNERLVYDADGNKIVDGVDNQFVQSYVEQRRTALREQIKKQEARLNPKLDRAARTEVEATLQEAAVTAAPDPGRVEVQPSERQAYYSRIAEQARDLDRQARDAEAQLNSLRSEYEDMSARVNDGSSPATHAALVDKTREIADAQATLDRVRRARNTRTATEEPVTLPSTVNDADAIRITMDEYRNVVADVALVEIRNLQDAGGGIPLVQFGRGLRDSLDTPGAATTARGRRTTDEYINMNGLDPNGVNHAVWANRVREAMPEYENLSDSQIMDMYFDRLDTAADLDTLPLDQLSDLVDEIAELTGMSSDYIRMALRGQGELSANITASARTVLDELVEELTESIDSNQAVEFAADRAAWLNERPAIVEQIGDNIIRLFDLEMSEQGLFGMGPRVGAAVQNLSVESLANWLDTGRVPDEVMDALTDSAGFSPDTIAHLDATVRYMNDLRDDLVTGERNLLASRDDVLAAYDDTIGQELSGLAAYADTLHQASTDAHAAARLADVQARRAEANVEPGYWQRPEEGLSPGERGLLQAGETRGRLIEQQQQNAWRQRKLDETRARERNLENSLEKGKQYQLRKADEAALGQLARIVQGLGGKRLGRFVAEMGDHGSMRPPRLTGVLGQIAMELGVYQRVMELYNDVGLPDRNNLMAQHGHLGLGEFPPEAALVYQAITEQGKWDALTPQRRVELSQALIQDDLNRTIGQYQLPEGWTESNLHSPELGATGEQTSLLKMDMLEQDLQLRLDYALRRSEELGQATNGPLRVGEIGRQLSDDYVNSIQQLFDDHRIRRQRQFETVNDANVAVMPRAYRTVAQNARRTLADQLNLASEKLAQSRELMRQAFKTEDPETRQLLQEDSNRARREAIFLADGADQIATSIRAMLEDAEGRITDTPSYVRGGAGIPLAGSQSTRNARSGRLEAATVSAEQQARSGMIELDFDNFTRREMVEAAALMESESIRQIANDPRTSAALTDVIADEIAEWQAQPNNYGVPSPHQMARMARDKGWRIVGKARRLDPNSSPSALRNDRWEAIDIDQLQPTDRIDFTDPDGPRVIREELANSIHAYLNPNVGNIGRNYDAMLAMWKVTALPLRPMWLVNNALGNAMMATVNASGQWNSPLRVIRELGRVLDIEGAELSRILGEPLNRRETLRIVRKAQDGRLTTMQNRLASANLTAGEWQGISGRFGEDQSFTGRGVSLMSDPEYVRLRQEEGTIGQVRGKAMEGTSVLAQGGYRLNSLVDNMFRSAVYNIELERLNADSTSLRRAADQNVTIEEMATGQALEALGDFSKLTPTERTWVRRFIPFWPWLRHQLAISWKLPVHSPMRAAMMATVYNIMVEDHERGPLWREAFGDSFTTPFGRVGLRGSNPFENPLEGSLSPFTGEGARVMSPLAAFALESIMPADISQGVGTSRPRDQGYLDEFGNVSPMTALERFASGDIMGGLGEVGYRLADQTQPTALLRDAALTQLPGTGYRGIGSRPFNVSTYDSGDVAPYLPSERGDLALLMSRLGLGIIPTREPIRETRIRANDLANAARRRVQGN